MKYLIIFFFSFWNLFTQAPEPKVFFNGTVKDKSTGKPIGSCKITVSYSALGTTFETVTDVKGNYKLIVVPGSFTVDYKFSGYNNVKSSYNFNPKSDTTVIANIGLTKVKPEKDDVEVIENTKVKEVSTRDRESPKRTRGLKLTAPWGSAAPSMSETGGKATSRGLTETSDEGISGDRVTYSSGGMNSDIKAGTLTAGEINDFSKWTLWADLSKGDLNSFVTYWGIIPKHRFSVQITNDSKSPLNDIQVKLKDPSGKVIWQSHTDNTGKAELWANLYDSTDLLKGKYTLEAIYKGKSYQIKDASIFSKGVNKLVIPAACNPSLNMDIVFAVDATGSMGDEIRYLQAELYDVIEKVKQGNPSLNLNMGSVFYRDKEDIYLTVEQDLTPDITKVMDFMKAQSADGGGDEPEGVDAAMEVAIGKFKWRSDARARVMFLVLDASPHHDKETIEKLNKYTIMAAEKGIRIVPIVCSGIDKASEYLMRSIALATNGNYIFLTDHSGIGDSHITPSTDKFDVETLNVLLIRLLQQYIFMPECNQTVNTVRIDSLQHSDIDSTINDTNLVSSPAPVKDSITNTKPDSWILKYYPNPCRGILKVDIDANISELYIADINGKLIMKIPVSQDQKHLEIDMMNYPAGVYFLRYCVDGKCKSGKFVLVH